MVYEAEHVHVGRKAAVKVLMPQWTGDPGLVQRFFNEARSSAMAKHPGIVEIFDCGTTDEGEVYLVMELLNGEPMHILLQREGALPVARALDLTRQMAAALAAAHANGIIHRDLKPDNIFVVPDRRAQTKESIKVLDFGVAKLATAAEPTMGVIGTPLYMPPEQYAASADVDARSDVYALGCIAFEMLCGRPPFVHDDPHTVANMHVHDPPPRVRDLRPDVPFNVDGLIARALAKNPDERPQSMHDLRAELDVAWSLLESHEPDKRSSARDLGPAVVRVSVRDDGGGTGRVLVPVFDDAGPAAGPPDMPVDRAGSAPGLVGPTVVTPGPSGRGRLLLVAGVALAVTLALLVALLAL